MSEKKKTPKQEAKELEIIERGSRVVELRKSGASYRAIAAKLREEGQSDVTYQTVRRDCKEALRLLAEHRMEETDEMRELQLQRYESLLLAHWIPALGRVEKMIDPVTKKFVVDPNTNLAKVKQIEPSIPSAWLIRAILNDISDLFSLKVQKHEHTGKNGEPLFPKVYAGFDPDKV